MLQELRAMRLACGRRKHSDVASFASYDAIILAVPAQAVRDVLTVIKPPKDIPLIISAKGIEQAQRQVHE